MYLCICKGITLRQAQTEMERGLSPREALNRLGIGSDCGTCYSESLNYLAPDLVEMASTSQARPKKENS